MYKNKIIILLFVIFDFSCMVDTEEQNTTENTESSGFNKNELDSLVTQKIDIIQPEEVSTPKAVTTSVVEPVKDSENNTYNCITTKYQQAPGFTELPLADVNETLIYPGAIFEAESIHNGTYIPIYAKRKPLKISISVLGLDTSVSTINNPNILSSTREALNKFFQGENLNKTNPTANSSLSTFSIYSEEQLARSLGFNVKASFIPKLNIGAGVEFSTKEKKQKKEYVTQFLHKYYSIDIDLPNKPSDFFDEMPNLKSAYSPVYISSVTYGRMALISTTATKTENEVKTSYEAVLSKLKDIKVGPEYEDKFRTSFAEDEVRAFVKGGKADNGSGVTDDRGMLNYLKNGTGEYYDAVPLSYKLNSLKDNRVIRVVLPTEYNVRECAYTEEPTKEIIDESLSLQIFSAKGCCDTALTTTTQFYGSFKIGTTNLPVNTEIIDKTCTDVFKSGGHFVSSNGIIPSARENAISLSSTNFTNVTNWKIPFVYTKSDAIAKRNIAICAEKFCDADSVTGDDCGTNKVRILSLDDFKKSSSTALLNSVFTSTDFTLDINYGKSNP